MSGEIDVRVAINEAVAALNSASLLPATFRKDTIAGALVMTSAALNAFTPEEVERELEILLTPTYVFLGGRTYEGYTSAQIIAATENFDRPTLVSSVPDDDATDVDVAANIELTFSEDVIAGAGAFELWLNDTVDVLIQTFDRDSSAMSIDGEVVTLNPTSNLTLSAAYYVLWSEGAVLAADDGAPVAAQTSTTALSFTVEAA